MRRLRLIFALLVLGGALLTPSAAFARVSEYQVQYTVRSTGGVEQLIVNVVLSPETALPATVQVPLPAGAKVVWSGEIVGEDPTADPFREAVVTAVDGGLVATFTMEQVRVAQVEADVPAPTVSGNDVSAVLNWVNTGEEGPYTFAVVLEAGATDVTISPAAGDKPVSNEAGETLHTLPPVRLAAGQAFPIDVSYRTGAAAGAGTTSTVLTVVAVLLSIALVVLLVVLRVRRAAPRSSARGGQPSTAPFAPPEARVMPSVEPPEAVLGRPVGSAEREGHEDDFFTFE